MHFRRHDELVDAFPKRAVELSVSLATGCQIRAPFFIVRGLRVIDGVVEPKRKLECWRVFALLANSIELAQAFRNVALIVIEPMRLGIGAGQSCVPGEGLAFCPGVQLRDGLWNEERSKLWSNGTDERSVARREGRDGVGWKC